MDDADGAEVFAYTDITWQVTPPPAQYPVPARHAADLRVGDELTIGLPGRYYIDGQVLTRLDRESITLPREATEREALQVASPLHWWMSKAYPTMALTVQWWPVDYTWIYRDAVSPGEATSRAGDDAGREGSWLAEIQPTLDVPPPRRPKPAREASGLTGRRVRIQHAPGEWSWRYAVSEPVEAGGDISVQVLPAPVWWIAQVNYHGEMQDQLETLPIHRLFVYG
jgi:hypothetical protein